MIRVTKPTAVPTILTTRGAAENQLNIAAYDLNPAIYKSGRGKFDIKNTIYGDRSVKGVLRSAQHDKCCFCEKSQVDQNGAVEHYRPKNGIKSARKDKLTKPGYFWLGYDWQNLFFVCSACNSTRYKGNLFPLVDEQARVRKYNHNINQETPFLINPAGAIDPRGHIVFDREYPRGLSRFGQRTIEICGLDRESLAEKRKKLLTYIDLAMIILDKQAAHTRQQVNQAKRFLRNAQKTDAEFSAVAIDYIKRFNIQGL